MDTIYNVIFLKTEWTKELTINFLQENKFKYTGLEENGDVLCYTIDIKDIITDDKPSLLISLTPSVFIIVKDNGQLIESSSDSDDEKLNPPSSLESSVDSLIDLNIKETKEDE